MATKAAWCVLIKNMSWWNDGCYNDRLSFCFSSRELIQLTEQPGWMISSCVGDSTRSTSRKSCRQGTTSSDSVGHTATTNPQHSTMVSALKYICTNIITVTIWQFKYTALKRPTNTDQYICLSQIQHGSVPLYMLSYLNFWFLFHIT